MGFVLGIPTSLFIPIFNGTPTPPPPPKEIGWILAEMGKTNYQGIWKDDDIWVDEFVWYD